MDTPKDLTGYTFPHEDQNKVGGTVWRRQMRRIHRSTSLTSLSTTRLKPSPRRLRTKTPRRSPSRLACMTSGGQPGGKSRFCCTAVFPSRRSHRPDGSLNFLLERDIFIPGTPDEGPQGRMYFGPSFPWIPARTGTAIWKTIRRIRSMGVRLSLVGGTNYCSPTRSVRKQLPLLVDVPGFGACRSMVKCT